MEPLETRGEIVDMSELGASVHLPIRGTNGNDRKIIVAPAS